MADLKKKKEKASSPKTTTVKSSAEVKTAPVKTEAKATAKLKKAKKIKFLKSPTGLYNLAYNIGDTMMIDDADLLEEMITAGICTTDTK